MHRISGYRWPIATNEDSDMVDAFAHKQGKQSLTSSVWLSIASQFAEYRLVRDNSYSPKWPLNVQLLGYGFRNLSSRTSVNDIKGGDLLESRG